MLLSTSLFQKICTVSALCFTASGAFAQTYDCTMHNTGRGGWMGDRMIFSLVPKDVTGFVYDGVIKNAYDSPIAARVTKRKDTLWRYKWDVEGASSVNAGKLSLTYSALLNTKSGKVTVNGILHGGDNVISGEGRCKVVK